MFVKLQVYKKFARFNRDGLNKTEQRPKRIIVSLTSYPARINVVPYAIFSLLRQTMKPDKIILWLGSEKFPDEKLPPIFEEIKACGVEVKFREDLGPHTKYFYSLKEYPEDIVITVDDDFVYDDFVIETLYNSYLAHPECVSAMRVNKLTLEPDGQLAPYSSCKPEFKNHAGYASHIFFATGVGGVLYPPHSVNPEIFNIDAMMRLSPIADDMWLKFMEVMNNTKVASAYNKSTIPGWIVVGSQKYALCKTNVEGNRNDVQCKAILEAYADWRDSQGRSITEVIRED